MDKLPFRIAECEAFRKAKLIIPSIKTVLRDCFRLYLKVGKNVDGERAKGLFNNGDLDVNAKFGLYGSYCTLLR